MHAPHKIPYIYILICISSDLVVGSDSVLLADKRYIKSDPSCRSQR